MRYGCVEVNGFGLYLLVDDFYVGEFGCDIFDIIVFGSFMEIGM